MKAALLAILLFFGAQPKEPIDVPALQYTIPAPHPCNISPKAEGSFVPAVCITGDETRWTCADKSRVLLTAENGSKHCISFKEN